MKNTFGNALGLTILAKATVPPSALCWTAWPRGCRWMKRTLPSGWTAAAPAEMGFPPPAPSRMWWSF